MVDYERKFKIKEQITPRNLMMYKRAAKQFRKKSQLEKHQHMIKSIGHLHKKFIHEIQGIKHQQDIYYSSIGEYQSDITRDEVIEALLFLFGWSFRMGYMLIAWKK
ncbi:hypothetical protein RFI_24972, partial [Reticulomyxa filosa]